MLSKSRAEKRQVREPKINETGEAFMPDDRSVAESNSTWGLVNMDSMDTGNPTEEMRKSSSKLPWVICVYFLPSDIRARADITPAFDSGNLTISCTVLFPEQFDALRRTYGCDKSMVESLARCIKWDASGGKSGSGFLKTRGKYFLT
jgi:1-phosphatidylinositol-3-phosphate 5-kinase